MDGAILIWIQEHLRSAALTPLMQGVSIIGNGGIFWIALVIGLLIPKKTRAIGLTAGIALAMSFVCNNLILKNLVARTRPYVAVEGLHALVAPLKDYSFPSGHAAAAFSTGTALWRLLPRKAGVPLMILAALMSFSRLYVGVHYPTDVLFGALSGACFALLAVRYVYPILKKKWQGY